MKERNYIIILTLAVALILGGISYSYYSYQKVTLTFGVFAGSNWDVPNGDSYAIFDEAVKKFEKEHPNVTINIVSGIQKDDYSEYISQLALNDQCPDVFMVLSEDFSAFAENGLLQNVSSYISEDKTFDKNSFYEASYNAGIFNDSVYALPFESVPTMMFVNKTLLESEGIELPSNDWTWDDFYRICEEVTKDSDLDGKLDQFGVYNYTWKEAMYTNDAQIFTENGTELNLNTTQMEEVIKFTQKINALNQKISLSSEDFDKGNVAFCPMQYSQYRAYKPYPYRVKKYSNFEWDVLPLPSGYSGDNTSNIETLLMGMSSQSNNKSYAWQFLTMLTNDKDIQQEIFNYSQGVSPLKEVTQSIDALEVIDDLEVNSNFSQQILNDVMEKGNTQINFKNYKDIISFIDTEIYRIVNSTDTDISLDMKSLQQKTESYIKK